jgi:hypothetical protein
LEAQTYALPKTVDELRTLTNPKVSYEGRVIKGQGPGQRGIAADISKNKPYRYYKNSVARYSATPAGVVKETSRPSFPHKDTNRQETSTFYEGPSAPAVMVKNNERIERYEDPKTQQLEDFGVRNTSAVNTWKPDEKTGDYGKHAIANEDNERTSMESNTYASNVVAVVKALVAPIEDFIRHTRKENAIGNIRLSGNVNLPVKNTPAVDPSDVPRTTIKETNIHNNHVGFVDTTGQQITVMDPNNVMRTTIKETNIENSRAGNIAGPVMLTVYDPNDVQRTTLRETNIHNTVTGPIATGYFKTPVHDPKNVPRTTVKETNLHNERSGNMGQVPSGVGYGSKMEVQATLLDAPKTTMKETVVAEYQKTNLSGVTKARVHDPNDVPSTTMKETSIDNQRTGNVTGRESQYGYITNEASAKPTSRQFLSDHEYVGDAVGPAQGAYEVTEYDAKTVNRQFLADNEYTGAAGSYLKDPMSYSDAYNATLNPNKQEIAKGRAPTQSSVKLLNSGVNVEVKKFEERNDRDLTSTRVVSLFADAQELTKEKQGYSEDNRNTADLLTPFRKNPYTKPLDSSA